jgi:hypothetical protein
MVLDTFDLPAFSDLSFDLPALEQAPHELEAARSAALGVVEEADLTELESGLAKQCVPRLTAPEREERREIMSLLGSGRRRYRIRRTGTKAPCTS